MNDDPFTMVERTGKVLNHDGEELTLLREFYRAWKHLHSIPNERGNRQKSEAAAEALVAASHAVEAHRSHDG